MKWNLNRFRPLGPLSTVLDAEPATIYEILTDYDNYLEWFPLTNHSKLLVKEGEDLAIAEFAFEKPKNTKLTVECIHTVHEMVLHRRISGNLPMLRVQWNLAAEGAGKTRVTLRTEMDFRNWRMFYPGVAARFGQQSLMRALEGRVVAFSSEFQLEGGRKFLEIVQTDEHLEVWFLGKKYKLTPLE